MVATYRIAAAAYRSISRIRQVASMCTPWFLEPTRVCSSLHPRPHHLRFIRFTGPQHMISTHTLTSTGRISMIWTKWLPQSTAKSVSVLESKERNHPVVDPSQSRTRNKLPSIEDRGHTDRVNYLPFFANHNPNRNPWPRLITITFNFRPAIVITQTC